LLAVLMAAGCTRAPKSRELTALDRAYDAGVLTKVEYDTKKALFTAKADALAALEKARETGVLTSAEYEAKRAALLGTAAPTPPPLPEKEAPPAPETTAAAPAPAPVASELPPPTPPPSGRALRMKLVKILDQNGFEKPIVSASLLLPTDWQYQGATQWNIKDSCNSIATTFRSSGPDGRGFEVFPSYNWVWADDPTFLRQSAAQKAQFGTHACDVTAPMGAADYLRRNLPRFRPNAQIAAIEPMTKLMQQAREQAQQTERMAAQYGLHQQVRPDIVRARLKYSLNGKPVEEWMVVKTVVTGTLGPSFNMARGGMTQAWSYNCQATAMAQRAPAGQLDSSEKFFELLVSTIRVNPDWQARITQHAQSMQQIELKGVRDRAAIVSKNADDIRNIQRQSYENKQKSDEHISAQFSEYIRGVETYRNPSTGETVELSNQYGHAWVNNRGEYLLSDRDFDPSVEFKEDWKPLEHVKK
jgi:hypothetical protein